MDNLSSPAPVVAFADLLASSGLSKAELARRLGVTPSTVSRWNGEPPRYAVAYLEAMVEIKRQENLVELYRENQAV